MAEKTSRDSVWNAALVKTVKQGKAVTPAEIADMADVCEQTARDCLLVMSDDYWLQRRTKPDGRVQYISDPGLEYDHETTQPPA